MEYRLLGKSGLYVSAIGLGAANFGKFGETTEQDCLRIAHCAFDGGITLVDTADVYSLGQSELIVGKAVAGRRDKVVLATKCGAPLSDNLLERGSSRRWITAAVNQSLKRLNTDYIDIFQVHGPDPLTDISETVGVFTDLIRAGKVRYFGTSNFAAQALMEAILRAEMRGLIGPHCEQAPFSILNRRAEGDILPMCEKFGLGFLAYSPLEGGLLSGKYRRGHKTEVSARQKLQPQGYDFSLPHNMAKLDAIEQLRSIADEVGIELLHLAMGFVLSHRCVTSALIGGGKMEYIQKHIEGQNVSLSDEILDKIDAIVSPGVTLDPTTNFPPPALVDSSLRRRRRGMESRQ
jgi:aryl-alcohol dehydrogenase-like predicted oxidoreductase